MVETVAVSNLDDGQEAAAGAAQMVVGRGQVLYRISGKKSHAEVSARRSGHSASRTTHCGEVDLDGGFGELDINDAENDSDLKSGQHDKESKRRGRKYLGRTYAGLTKFGI